MYDTKIPLQHLAVPWEVQHAGWLRDRVDIDRRDVDHTSTNESTVVRRNSSERTKTTEIQTQIVGRRRLLGFSFAGKTSRSDHIAHNVISG